MASRLVIRVSCPFPTMSDHEPGAWDASTRRQALAYADALHSLARYLTGARTDAEDLVQETYVRAFAAQTRFAAGTNLKAWLFRILRNTFVDGYRRARHGPVDDGAAVDAPDDVAPPAPEPTRSGAGTPRDIEAAMLALSEEARTVVLLDLEGFTETETAAIVGCAVGTVKSRLARARAELRKRLIDYAGSA
jgi:RNA polymerase sigma-70 factor (ECF subfamily)